MTKDVLTILREKAVEDFARDLFTEEVLDEISVSRERVPEVDKAIRENTKHKAVAGI